MIRVLGTVIAALLGLAFGSFLNVCLSRWPEGESVVQPRSHCRQCGRTLAWWENVPLLSWIALRGRCRGCGAWIGWRYPLVELLVGASWAVVAWSMLEVTFHGYPETYAFDSAYLLAGAVGFIVLFWLLIALAVLDAEQFWLPDWLTIPGAIAGFVVTLIRAHFLNHIMIDSRPPSVGTVALNTAFAIIGAAGLILLIRWIYWLVRRREGLGLGDAKLMAMLAAWLGFSGALLAFGLGVLLGALVALIVLLIPRRRLQEEKWAQVKLPLGTFLCIGGIVSALWGQGIIAAYLRWAGL